MAKMQHKVIFLDRDGVINVDPEFINEYMYVTKWEEFKFIPRVKRAIKRLTDNGYSIYVISNQAGIGKGYFTKKALSDITGKMQAEIEKAGGRIAGAYYCPHRKEQKCACRKPKTGLFKKALKNGKIDFKGTYFIGDNIRDVVAGQAIGCRTILVLSGKTSRADVRGAKWEARPDFIKRDLYEAVELVLRRDKKR
ncbi:MAG: HAD-IIIA family hydrolase [Candidatus Omnitrophota bacterium]|jgi:D-glycero-D-manno-heptose 1,7-bisphosphate phosphatase